MIWAIGYGIAVCVVVLIVWQSHDRTTRIMSAILGFEWLAQNAAVDPDRWWALNPANIGTVLFAVVIMTSFLPVTSLTLGLFAIYGATMLLDVWVAFAALTLERWYFDAVNGTFALRLLVVGGWGGWCAIRHWRSVGDDRPLPVSSSRATLVRRRAF